MIDDVPELTITEALALLERDEATFVDVRDGGSYEWARIPGALAVTDANVEEFVAAAQPGRTVVVYCYHGHSSLGGAAFFLSRGLERVFSLHGGYTAWNHAGFPSEGASIR